MFPPIYTILSAAPVAALVGDRIYPHGDAPQGVTEPYITWFVVAGPPELVLDGAPPHDTFTIQVDCWHPVSAVLLALGAAVRSALEAHCHVTSLMSNQRDAQTKLYRVALQLEYILSRP